MNEPETRELLRQLKRIADALEIANEIKDPPLSVSGVPKPFTQILRERELGDLPPGVDPLTDDS